MENDFGFVPALIMIGLTFSAVTSSAGGLSAAGLSQTQTSALKFRNLQRLEA